MGSRPFAIVTTVDQWARCAHHNTTVDELEAVVSLAMPPEPEPKHLEGTAQPAAGLALDGACRLYHSVPEQGRLDVQRLALEHAPAGVEGAAGMLPFLEGLDDPRGLSVDAGQRLWVADAGARRLLVYDLFARTLVRTIPLAATPLGLAVAPVDGALGQTVYGVTAEPAGWFRAHAHGELEGRSFDATCPAKRPGRLAVSSRGTVVLLDAPGTADATLYRLEFDAIDVANAPQVALAKPVPWATDVTFLELNSSKDTRDEREVFAVAGGVNERPLVYRYLLDGRGFTPKDAWSAPGYDGRGIVRVPLSSAREAATMGVGYFTARGFRVAAAPARSYFRHGTVAVFQLDSGQYQTRWGRLFIDACIPAGTSLGVKVLTADALPEYEPQYPAPASASAATPPLPPRSLGNAPSLPLHRRENGSERPWVKLSPGFETWEAPLRSPQDGALLEPGRYLWLVLELSGTGKTSPRVHCLRAEYPGHDLLTRLPRVFSRERLAGDFLQLMLAPLEGVLDDLDARAQLRQLLVLPDATPEELLPWLASFVGLVMDQRWSTEVRRRFLAETVPLFRTRGTLGSLARMLELALGVRPVLLEQFRMRGVAQLEDGGATAGAVLGGGMRVGGALGATESVVAGAVDDVFATHAHRFSVFLPAGADVEDRARFILDSHRPAHTVYDLCTLDSGMRVGLGLHVGVSSFVGHSAKFATAQLGGSALGHATLGARAPGTSVGDVIGGGT